MHDEPLVKLAAIEKTFHQQGPTDEGTQEALAVQVLKGIDLTIAAGEFCALKGTSGSGKSTLLHIIGLLDRPTAGSYHLRGEDVSTLSDDALSQLRNIHVGFVFQSFYLIPYASALDNVLMPGLYANTPTSKLKARASELLELVGLADRKHFKPAQLSGGQQQRVALARALINEPDLLLADEPTGQLDSTTSTEIMELMGRINADGTTIVVVTHDELTAGYARRILNMQDGKIVAEERDG